jgi:multidrug efflux system membrane fusion protein
MTTLEHAESLPVAVPWARPGRRTGRRVAATVILIGLGAGVGAVAVNQAGGSGGAHAAAATTVATGTATVTSQDLVDREQENGTLGYQAGPQVANRIAGTFTHLPDLGAVISQGQALYSVDNLPVTLMYGAMPAWRTLADGVDDGPDVRQLEQSLTDLGYANARNLTVDNHFTSDTAAAVKRWQHALGLPETGQVDLGRVVFLPGAARVSAVHPTTGSPAQPGSPVLDTTSTTKVVTVALDATKTYLVKTGDAVEVTLPDQKLVSGSVTAVGKVATSASSGSGGANSSPTVAVTIGLADASAGGDLDQAPVQVGITTASRRGVLVVPVNALLAVSEGGYAVEVVDGGVSHLVAVTTGLFANGNVEISGAGIQAGTKVKVPVS